MALGGMAGRNAEHTVVYASCRIVCFFGGVNFTGVLESSLKVAICVSGQVRDFESTWEKSIANIFHDVEYDVYLDVWDKRGTTTAIDRVFPKHFLQYLIGETPANKYEPADLRSKFPVLFRSIFENTGLELSALEKVFSPVQINTEVAFESLSTEKRILDVRYPENLKKSNPRDFNCLPMFYKMYKCNKAVSESGKSYDFVARVRPDLYCEDKIYIPWAEIGDSLLVRDTHSSNHVDDQFAIAKPEVMDIYSSTWKYLTEYWDAKSVRTNTSVSGFLLAHHLDIHNVKIMRQPWSQMLTTSRADLDSLLDILIREVESAPLRGVSNDAICFANEIYCELSSAKIQKSRDKFAALLAVEKDVTHVGDLKPWLKLHQTKGLIFERKKDFHQAVINYKQALLSDPYSFAAHSGLARIYKSSGQIKLSAVHYLSAQQIRPHDWFVLRDVAQLMLDEKKYQDAAFYVNKAFKVSNENKSIGALREHILALDSKYSTV